MMMMMMCVYARRASDQLSAYARVPRRQERVRLVRGTRQAACQRHVLDPRRQRNDRLAWRDHQRVLDRSHGQ